MIIHNSFLTIATWIKFILLEIHDVGAIHEIPNELDLEYKKYKLNEQWTQKQWLDANIKLGQVSGVTVDRTNNIYLFHRVDRIWSKNSFTSNNIFNERNLGTIKNHTVLVLSPNGTLINKWGNEMFYLPHGITVDDNFNVWVTDVALHQVMKFSPSLWITPLLSLGTAFIPGTDSRHLCKPTAVAVKDNGDFFVADGYCNNRILKFNSVGDKILEWGRRTVHAGFRIPSPGELNVPHALTLMEELDLICVADRENGRVQCFNALNASYAFQLKSEHIGTRVFSVSYCKAKGLFFIINGEDFQRNIPVQGFIMTSKNVIVGKFGHQLKTPHDIALSTNCDEIYVGEIDPYVAWKFEIIQNTTNPQMSPETTITNENNISALKKLPENGEIEGLAGAIMVTGACLIFAASLVIGALVYSRARRTGTSDTVRLLPDSSTSEY